MPNPVTTSEDLRDQFRRGAIPAEGAIPNVWPLPKQIGFHSLKLALTQGPWSSALGDNSKHAVKILLSVC